MSHAAKTEAVLKILKKWPWFYRLLCATLRHETSWAYNFSTDPEGTERKGEGRERAVSTAR